MRLLGLVLALASLLAAQPITVIRGARVVDGSGAPARSATVVIRGSRIEAVGDVPVPDGARVIDAAGQTLLPGIFDLHTHLTASAATGAPADWGKNLKAYLDCGITTVNDYSTYGEMYAPMRRILSTGTLPGPHVNLAARLSVTGGHGTEGGWGDFMTLEANTPEQAHARMKTALAYKPDVIKVFNDGWRYNSAPDLMSMNVETLAAIVADAHAAGIKVVTHTVTLRGAKIAARAGVDILVHGIGDAEIDDELVALMKASHTFYVSTLAVYETHQYPLPERSVLVLDPAARAVFAGRTGGEGSPARQERWQHLLANVHRLHDAGIQVAAGTDAGMSGTFHGYASLHELELLVEAGLKPMDAIMAGTSISARAMGLDADRGLIAPGKAGDLVLIDGRPDEKIADIMKTSRVFLAGVEIDRKQLEASIQSDALTPMPQHAIAKDVDDFEHDPAHTQLGTLRVNATDPGIDHSAMLFQPVLRQGGGHALLVSARLAAKDRPWTRLELPLTPGAVELGDVSAYEGITFEARGEGAFRLMMQTYGIRGRPPASDFTAAGDWQTIKIPFKDLQRGEAGAAPWDPHAVRALAFEISGPSGSTAWLELDNVRFY